MLLNMDSSALVAFLRREPGWEVVRRFLRDPLNQCYVHAVNLMEVYYEFYRQGGKQGADLAIASLDQAGVILRDDMDPAFWEDAGAIKAEHRRISIADCFCIALARRVGGEVVTSDHHEFDRIVPLGLCPVRFIR